MTLQERARSKAIWAAKVIALFVFAGGAVGGAAVGLALVVIAIATAPQHYFGSAVLLQMPLSLLAMAFFGLFFGFPAAVLTAAAYLLGAPTMRLRWPLTAFGVLASALCGALFIEMVSTNPTPLESYLGTAAFFAFAGGAATLACFSLLKRLGLQAPI